MVAPISLTIPSVIGLAIADSINPCELSILTLILVSILTKFPRERKKILQIGLAFIATMFIVYLIYGLFLVNIFKSITQLAVAKLWIYKIFGALGILLGAMNIKDFFKYGSLGFVTEVPRKWRPKMKEMIAKISSVKGAAIIGLFCALFLTPCTIGPYILCCGLLEPLQIAQSIPWLLLYNLIFILPMIIITLIIYFGFSTVDNVYGWREKNLRIMHLITGIILVLIGLALIFGWL